VDALVTLLPDPDAGEEDSERLMRRLRGELAELDVDSIVPVAGAAAPPGSKGLDPVALGAIVVAMSASGGVFGSVIGTVKDLLERQAARHRIAITIDGDTIELERASVEQQSALVGAYISRHSAPKT
jgi:hypothetical protein